MLNLRTVIAAAALTLVGGAAVAAASLTNTNASGANGSCAGQTWPNFSADCVDGAGDRTVRRVSVERTNADEMAARFEVAFQ